MCSTAPWCSVVLILILLLLCFVWFSSHWWPLHPNISPICAEPEWNGQSSPRGRNNWTWTLPNDFQGSDCEHEAKNLRRYKQRLTAVPQFSLISSYRLWVSLIIPRPNPIRLAFPWFCKFLCRAADSWIIGITSISTVYLPYTTSSILDHFHRCWGKKMYKTLRYMNFMHINSNTFEASHSGTPVLDESNKSSALNCVEFLKAVRNPDHCRCVLNDWNYRAVYS